MILGTGGLSHQLHGERFGFVNEAWDNEFKDRLETQPETLAGLPHQDWMLRGGTEGVEMCNGLHNRSGIQSQTMRQFGTRNPGKAGFMMGLGFALAKATNVDQHLQVQNTPAELIRFTEVARACLRASEVDATPNQYDVMTPAALPLWSVQMMFPKMFVRA